MNKIGRILALVGFIAILVIGVAVFVIARMQPPSIGFGDPQNLLPQITPTIYPSAATVIEGVQTLSRLETASYHIEKVITAESGQGPMGFLFGDKLLLIAHGQVIAGVDLSDIGPDDLTIDGDGVVYLRMPPVEVFVATLDNNRTYVYDRRTGVAGLNPQLETSARQEAERLILQAAVEDGLEDKAEDNARDFLRSFILGLGFTHLIFVDELPDTPSLTDTPVITVATP